MFYLYCLPGKMFAELSFLWPRRGQIWPSGRRRDSRIAHFFYSTIFWGLLIWLFVLPHFEASPRQEQGDSSAATTVLTGDTSADRPRTTPNLDAQTDVAPADTGGTNVLISPDGAEGSIGLLTSEAVQDAMRTAFASGRPERWHEGNRGGYAVPSEVVVAGCRNVRVSSDRDLSATVQAKVCG